MKVKNEKKNIDIDNKLRKDGNEGFYKRIQIYNINEIDYIAQSDEEKIIAIS